MIYLALYIGTIFLANLMIAVFGLWPVGFGLWAPAGVYAVGLNFTLRDLAQERVGRRAILAAIVAGAALSALVSPQFALASGVTFLVSETADYFVYTPLHKRSFLGAVAASNTVGLVVDSALFLWLAFGSLQFLAGQIVGKVEMTLLAVALIWIWRRRRVVISDRGGVRA
jgi:uncharacterized PurR-regulated membrane protein YhhQ (DUF165 family)